MGRKKCSPFTISYKLDSKSILWKACKNNRSWIYEILLNKELLEKYEDLYINEVFCHEYAHLVIFKMFPTWYNWKNKVNGHWKEFKAVCSWFWIDWKSTTQVFQKEMLDKKTHLYKWLYKCNCQEHLLTTRRHNSVLNWNKKYNCKNCKCPIIYIWKN